MSAWMWAGVLLAAVWAAHWGAEKLAEPLKKLRSQWGFSEAAGAALIGVASAAPELGINVASAFRGVAEIGLGAALGANIIAIPLVITVAYWATRKERLGQGGGNGGGGDSQQEGTNSGGRSEHAHHLQEGLLRVKREAVTVQALPYLGILALFAVLTVTPGWRGLQPLDGWILLGAYLAYAAQALLRGRGEGQQVEWSAKEIWLALGGVLALAVGAYFTVRSTENIVSALGISRLVGGLFITAPVAALPEMFAAWSVARSGQVTTAATGVLGDLAATMTLAFIPLALITVAIQNPALFYVNLAFLALMPAIYAGFIHWSSGDEHGLKLWQVLVLDAVYLAYLAIALFGVLKVAGE